MAARGKPDEGESSSEGGDAPVTRAELNDFKESITKLLDEYGSKQKAGGAKGSQATERQTEAEARESVEEAFRRLDAQKAHDEHHARLAEREKAAEERATAAARKAPPVESGKTRNRFWDY